MDSIKTVGDITSISIVAGTLTNILPPLAALLTIVWTGIRIYETKTIRKCIRSWRIKKKELDVTDS